MRARVLPHWLAGVCLIGLLYADKSLAAPFLTAFPIATTAGHERFPKIDGRYVVWTDVAYLGGPAGSTNDAYAYDLVLNQTITLANGARYQDEPSISGSVAIWTDWTPGSSVSADIFGRNLSGGANFTVTTAGGSQSAHEISGDLVVWHDNRNGTTQVWGRKLSQPVGSDFAISSTSVTYEQSFPDVSGSVAVWMSFLEPGDQGNIYGRDVNSGGVFPVTTNAGYQNYPKISGRNVVWNDTRDGQVRVYGRNLDAGGDFPISSGIGGQYEVAIDGDLVVWRDDRAGVSDIWGRYLSGGPEFQITNTPTIWEDYPDVSGKTVVWEQSTDGSATDIYATVVPEPSIGILLLGCITVLRRRSSVTSRVTSSR